MFQTLKYSAKIGVNRWVILTSLAEGRWQVQLWGTDNMEVQFVGLTVEEAKENAIALVSLFLLQRDPVPILPGQFEWRSVLSLSRQRYRFQTQ